MASEAQFTPGPWSVVEYGDGDSLAVHDALGDWRVCFMATPSKDGDFEGIEANARLIAAAPELYEEAEFLCARLIDLESDILDDEVGRQYYGHVAPSRARLQSILAKARGEPTHD